MSKVMLEVTVQATDVQGIRFLNAAELEAGLRKLGHIHAANLVEQLRLAKI